MLTRELPDSTFGIEVTGRDLRTPLTGPEQAELRGLVDRHRLVLFRGQDITGDQQVGVLAALGPVLDESKDGSRFTHVSNTLAEGVVGRGRLLFHSDLAFTPRPIDIISLYGIELPPDGAPTLFADAVAAAAALPGEVRARLEGRRGLHIFDLRDNLGDRRFRVADLPDTAPRAMHPVLVPHPRTGETTLFVSEMQTDHVEGLPPDESEELLAACCATLYRPENTYEHVWRPGDLVVWDNIALQHARGEVAAAGGRTLRRVPVGTLAVQLQPA